MKESEQNNILRAKLKATNEKESLQKWKFYFKKLLGIHSEVTGEAI